MVRISIATHVQCMFQRIAPFKLALAGVFKLRAFQGTQRAAASGSSQRLLLTACPEHSGLVAPTRQHSCRSDRRPV